MRLFYNFLYLLSFVSSIKLDDYYYDNENNCISFTVGQGTGCAWMCNYCANQLGTNNFYFTDNVCVYKDGEGCVGNPVASKVYSCCSA